VLAAHEELTRPQALAAVEDLVTQGATGVLEITGSPSGEIYLDSGYIAFARASWVPGLAARLRGIRPVPAGLAELADWGASDAAIAAHLVQRGYLTMAAMHELVWSIVVDAFVVLTIPLASDSPVTAIRFTSTRTYWAEMFPRLGIGAVRSEAIRRAERMADCALGPTTLVAMRDLGLPAAVLTPQQQTIACQLLGTPASARDLALRYGAALTDTAEWLGGLIQAGLCVPVRVAGHKPLTARASRPVPGQSPSVETLRQVLNGLRKLS
jgi:hypothetical protein